MDLRNREGTPIDPIPFLVVALLGVTVFMAWGPLYLKEHGVAEPAAVGCSGALAAGTVGVAYYQYVWNANPAIREEVPAGVRFRKLLYAILIGVVVLLALVMLVYV